MKQSLMGILVLALVATGMVSSVRSTRGCPICGGGIQRTLSDELKDASAVILARRAPGQKSAFEATGGELRLPREIPKTKFEIIEVLKGEEHLKETKTIELLYFGEDPESTTFLIQAPKLDELVWGTPLPIDERAVKYIRHLPELPEKGLERLKWYYGYLEDENNILARDAYDEISRLPFPEIAGLKEHIDRQQMIRWITTPETATSHKRLYLTLLGLVARGSPTEEELKYLEGVIRDDSDGPRTALDSTIACFLTLKGPEGMPLIEERFLKNKKSGYSDTYATIMALRFHAEQDLGVPKERVVAALRNLLDRPDLADLIIADLARMEDWSVMDRLVELFENADEKTNWVRVPVIQYLKACPEPAAEKHIERLAKIDPKAMQRAALFVPIARPNPAPPVSDKGTTPDPAAGKSPTEKAPAGKAASGEGQPAAPPAAEKPNRTSQQVPSQPDADQFARSETARGQSADEPVVDSNRGWTRLAPLGVGVGVFALLMWSLRTKSPA